MPKNIIAVDFAPIIGGSIISDLGNFFADNEAPTTYIFGIGAHYERHISESFSIGGRFSYMGGNLWYKPISFDSYKTDFEMNVNAISLEAHGRFYAGRIFFIDAMMGYANMTTAFKGTARAVNEVTDPVDGHLISSTVYSVPISETISRHFLLLGAKIGWRIDGGDPGGFIFEPSLGWTFGIGNPLNSVGNQLVRAYNNEDLETMASGLDLLYMIYENFFFIGGPRLSLCAGWRF